jgi:hypothetical protein
VDKGKGHVVKLELEVMGGFTGPAGKQVIHLDLDRLPEPEAAELRRELNAVPKESWGGSFLNPHPQSWDFRYVLSADENGRKERITFHRNQGPAALTRLADLILKDKPSSG